MTVIRYGVFDPDDLTFELNYTTKVTDDGDGVFSIDLHEIYRILRVHLIDIVRGRDNLIAFVDDEGLLNGSTIAPHGALLMDAPGPAYAGRMLICGDDGRGGTLSLTVDQEEDLAARALQLGLVTAVISPVGPTITVEPLDETADDEETMFVITIDHAKEGSGGSHPGPDEG